MKISSPSRNTRARKPSHFGSKIQSPSAGNSSTRFASIGKIGGFTGRSTPHGTRGNPDMSLPEESSAYERRGTEKKPLVICLSFRRQDRDKSGDPRAMNPNEQPNLRGVDSHYGAVRCEFAAFDFGLKDRPEELRVPLILLVVRNSVGVWILSRDVPGSEDHVPEKKHIPEVALVVANSVVRCSRVMGVVGSRS